MSVNIMWHSWTAIMAFVENIQQLFTKVIFKPVIKAVDLAAREDT